VAVLGLFAFCLAWRLDGGRWERVETPSMGTVAPVGTLLWVKPVAFDSLRPGDFITFRPPGSSGGTYSHRVLARQADGTVTTKGVLSAPDPWRLTADDVVGMVRLRGVGVGWLVQAAPLLLAGGLVAALAVRVLRKRWRAPVAVVLAAVVLSIPISWLRPLVNAEQLSFAPSAGGGADAAYVGTGLLPIRLTAEGGASVVMHDGEVGRVHVEHADGSGRLRVSLSPAVPWWWWAALVGACFVPALAAGRPRATTNARDTGRAPAVVVRHRAAV
jgi:hypothetical protein